jgi:hypothetical protein
MCLHNFRSVEKSAGSSARAQNQDKANRFFLEVQVPVQLLRPG